MAAIASAAILGGGSLLSGLFGAKSASDAAAAQVAQEKRALAQQKAQYEQTRGDLAPYRDNGVTAGNTYSGALGLNGQDAAKQAWSQYTESPGLQGMLSRIRDNVQASNAARGGLFSGATAQGIGDRSTQAYMEDSGNWLSRLAGMYGTGENAAAQTGQFGANSANAQSQIYGNMGTAQANGIIGGANSYNNALGNLASIYGAQRGGAFGSGNASIGSQQKIPQPFGGYGGI